MSASRSKLDKEISGLKASLQADSSRHTELKMAMKEADIMFKDILKVGITIRNRSTFSSVLFISVLVLKHAVFCKIVIMLF